MVVLTGSVAHAHPFHVSVAEVEHNRETRRLEISLRVHPADLEKAISRRARRRIDLERSEGLDELIAAYLRERIVVRPAKGAPGELVWVGKEVDVKHAWLYFEIRVPDGVDGLRVSSRVFFELHREQSNLVTFKDAGRRASLRLSPTRSEAAVLWKLARGGMSCSRSAGFDTIPDRPSALERRCTFGATRSRSSGRRRQQPYPWIRPQPPITPSPELRSSGSAGAERHDRALR